MKNLLSSLILSCLFSFSFGQWTKITTPSNVNISHTNFVNDSVGILLSNSGRMLRTEDEGVSWDSINTTYIYSWFVDAYFVNEDVAYVGGGANFPFPPSSVSDLILKTEDGGLSFDSIFGNYSGGEILAIDFADENNGMFLSSYQSFKTSNGGLTIDTLGFPSNVNNYSYGRSVAYPDLQHAYIVAHSSLAGPNHLRTIFKSVDQGDNWTALYTDTTSIYGASIEFVNGNSGIVAGRNGHIYSTDNGGSTWSKQVIDSVNFTDIAFINSASGFLSANKGDTSYLYSTLDGGNTWQIEEIDTGVVVTSISLTPSYIYASAWQGLYRKNIDTVATSIKDISDQGMLEIYPNPSQDLLYVNWDAKNFSKIKIYNVLGQTVLTKETTHPSIQLDISALDTGIYSVVLMDQNKIIGFSKLKVK